MRNKKPYIVVIIIIFAVLAFALAACNNDNNDNRTDPMTVAFTALVANGTADSVTTTELTLTFDVDPSTLAAADITLIGATRGALTGTGLVRTLAISNITVGQGEVVTVAISNPQGYTISPAQRTVAINIESVPTAVTFSAISANGTPNTADTTVLTLTFSESITLSANDITLFGATKGALTGVGTNYTLAISNITVLQGGRITVSLTNPTGFEISNANREVAVNRNIETLFANIITTAPAEFNDWGSGEYSWEWDGDYSAELKVFFAEIGFAPYNFEEEGPASQPHLAIDLRTNGSFYVWFTGADGIEFYMIFGPADETYRFFDSVAPAPDNFANQMQVRWTWDDADYFGDIVDFLLDKGYLVVGETDADDHWNKSVYTRVTGERYTFTVTKNFGDGRVKDIIFAPAELVLFFDFLSVPDQFNDWSDDFWVYREWSWNGENYADPIKAFLEELGYELVDEEENDGGDGWHGTFVSYMDGVFTVQFAGEDGNLKNLTFERS